MSFAIVLYEPEIPPNTGNILRLCANTQSSLHLIEPLGFALNDRSLKRAGLDYIDASRLHTYPDWQAFSDQHAKAKLWFLSSKAEKPYHQVTYQPDDFLVFGPETRGLPAHLLQNPAQALRIPMAPESRSINLANSVSIVLFEALRQNAFNYY